MARECLGFAALDLAEPCAEPTALCCLDVCDERVVRDAPCLQAGLAGTVIVGVYVCLTIAGIERGRRTLNITDLAASDVGRKIRIVGFGGEFEIQGILERVTYEWTVPRPEQWGSSPEIASVGLTVSGWEATLTPTTTCELLTAKVAEGRTP
ncbi:hypothetical protein J2S97_004850 [Arthrobacter oryzae]|jgi:hypothetical protein|nr:hypothetical protein [Arthrobacter oryzae]